MRDLLTMETEINKYILQTNHSIVTESSCMDSIKDTLELIIVTIAEWFRTFYETTKRYIKELGMAIFNNKPQKVAYKGNIILSTEVINQVTDIEILDDAKKQALLNSIANIPNDIPSAVKNFDITKSTRAMADIRIIIEDMQTSVVSKSEDYGSFIGRAKGVKREFENSIRGIETLKIELQSNNLSDESLDLSIKNARLMKSLTMDKSWTPTAIRDVLNVQNKDMLALRNRMDSLAKTIHRSYASGSLSQDGYRAALLAYNEVFTVVAKVNKNTRKIILIKRDISHVTFKCTDEFGRIYCGDITGILIKVGGDA